MQWRRYRESGRSVSTVLRAQIADAGLSRSAPHGSRKEMLGCHPEPTVADAAAMSDSPEAARLPHGPRDGP